MPHFPPQGLNTTMRETHFRTCHLCETMCGIAVTVEDGQIHSIKGDQYNVLSKGNICPKASGLADVHTDPDRLKRPMKRSGDEWTEIGWEEAFEEVATRLADIQARYGDDSLATYQGRSTAHNIGALFGVPIMRRVLATKSTYTGSTIDQQPHNFVWYFMLGHQFMATVPNIDRTDYFLMLGTNPKLSNGAMMSTGANTHKKLTAIQRRGGKVVLLDPRRTESAEYCSEHHFIKPSTDALFLIGIINEIFAAGLATPGRLANDLVGWDDIEPALADFELEDISRVTGVAASDISRIAKEFATADSAVCYGRTGLSMQPFGGLCNWLMQVINIITGNFDEPGGMMFATPAIDALGTDPDTAGSYDTYRSRVRDRPEFAGELPMAVLAEEILTPGEGQLRGLLAMAGNPALSAPNGKHLEEAFDDLEFMVSIDPYLNETTRHANIILPPVGPFEKSHYDLFYHTYDTIDWATYHPPLFEPEAPGYTDFEIMVEVLRRYAPKRANGAVRRKAIAAVGRLGSKLLSVDRLLDLGLRFGPYGAKLNPFSDGLSLKKLKANPHGVFLGEPKPCLPERLFTADKKVHVAPAVIVADLPRLRAYWIDDPVERGEFDLTMVSRLTNRTLGWMHNSERLVRGKDVCTMLIHPDDAAERGLQDGLPATVRSAVGAIDVPVEVSDTMMVGVVCMPHAWGHTRPGTRLSVAEAHPGVSLNDITDEGVVDELTGNAIVHGVPVAVTRTEASMGVPGDR
jgi:anaerobic selenocysteine-containing dehydrogenase